MIQEIAYTVDLGIIAKNWKFGRYINKKLQPDKRM